MQAREPPDEGLMCECLWSDPQPAHGRAPSKRGIGVAFGPDVTRRFLADNRLSLVVRSHEVRHRLVHPGSSMKLAGYRYTYSMKLAGLPVLPSPSACPAPDCSTLPSCKVLSRLAWACRGTAMPALISAVCQHAVRCRRQLWLGR